MLIDSALLKAYNGIEQGEDETSQTLITIHIGTAQQIISNYVQFNCEEVLTDSATYDESAVAMFKNVCLRIATLLQLEDGGNIGVANNSSVGINRTYANIVDYTPYLKPLSVFRKIEGA
jgi:hypothetical protein